MKTRATILHLMSNVLYSKKRGSNDLERLLSRSDEFQEILSAMMERFCAPIPDFNLARKILGADFISPEQIAETRDLTYSNKQLANLKTTLPYREVLEWLKQNGYMVVAGPPQEMSLIDLREISWEYFGGKWRRPDWYTRPEETFSREEKVRCRWYILRKEYVPNSLYGLFTSQQKRLLETERVPTAVELVWGITTYASVLGIMLPKDIHVRTSSVTENLHHVTIGLLREGVLWIGTDYGAYPSKLGLSSLWDSQSMPVSKPFSSTP